MFWKPMGFFGVTSTVDAPALSCAWALANRIWRTPLPSSGIVAPLPSAVSERTYWIVYSGKPPWNENEIRWYEGSASGWSPTDTATRDGSGSAGAGAIGAWTSWWTVTGF